VKTMRGVRKRKRTVGGEERKKGQFGVNDALEGRHLVSLRELVDRWEGPCLTLSSQNWPTLSRRANIVKGVVEIDRPQPVNLVPVLLLLTLVLCVFSHPPSSLFLSSLTVVSFEGVLKKVDPHSDRAISCPCPPS